MGNALPILSLLLFPSLPSFKFRSPSPVPHPLANAQDSTHNFWIIELFIIVLLYVEDFSL